MMRIHDPSELYPGDVVYDDGKRRHRYVLLQYDKLVAEWIVISERSFQDVMLDPGYSLKGHRGVTRISKWELSNGYWIREATDYKDLNMNVQDLIERVIEGEDPHRILIESASARRYPGASSDSKEWHGIVPTFVWKVNGLDLPPELQPIIAYFKYDILSLVFKLGKVHSKIDSTAGEIEGKIGEAFVNQYVNKIVSSLDKNSKKITADYQEDLASGNRYPGEDSLKDALKSVPWLKFTSVGSIFVKLRALR